MTDITYSIPYILYHCFRSGIRWFFNHWIRTRNKFVRILDHRTRITLTAISQRHGSPDPNPPQIIMDPQHSSQHTTFTWCSSHSFANDSFRVDIWKIDYGTSVWGVHIRKIRDSTFLFLFSTPLSKLTLRCWVYGFTLEWETECFFLIFAKIVNLGTWSRFAGNLIKKFYI